MTERSHAIPSEWLALYYDGELDARLREQVEAHLAVCVSCQQELVALRELSGLLAMDRLDQGVFASQSVRAAWGELEQRLPERTAAAPSLLRWLSGLGLVIATVLVQFMAVVSVLVVLTAGQLGWIAEWVDWLDSALSGWFLGWIIWLLPASWSGWGLSLFLVIASAWLAVLYLAWLGYVWIERQQPATQKQSVYG